MNALGYILGLYALYKFKDAGLEIKYQKEIEEWLAYKKQLLFAEKLGKQILEEVDNYTKKKKTIEELIKERFPQPMHPITM